MFIPIKSIYPKAEREVSSTYNTNNCSCGLSWLRLKRKESEKLKSLRFWSSFQKWKVP